MKECRDQTMQLSLSGQRNQCRETERTTATLQTGPVQVKDQIRVLNMLLRPIRQQHIVNLRPRLGPGLFQSTSE